MARWKLDEGIELVRALQPITRKWAYHLTLGGGVLNKGESDKDLDLFFLPLNGGQAADPAGLKAYLEWCWGPGVDLFAPRIDGGAAEYAPPTDPVDAAFRAAHGPLPPKHIYRHALKFTYDGEWRIDVFIF